MPDIKTVWIDETCIGCNACVGTVPEVFALPEDRAVIRGAVRVDGITSFNEDEKSDLNAVGLEYSFGIIEAAEGCPVESIRFRTLI